MRCKKVLYCFFFLLWTRCNASETGESMVRILTEENWDEVINNTPLIMVEFYASW